MHPTDAALVEQCLKGEKDAFAEIVRRYEHLVYYLALTRMRDRVMAALPDTPRLTWRARLRSLWPEGRRWILPALPGALTTPWRDSGTILNFGLMELFPTPLKPHD
jgi:hypothetical protein